MLLLKGISLKCLELLESMRGMQLKAFNPNHIWIFLFGSTILHNQLGYEKLIFAAI